MRPVTAWALRRHTDFKRQLRAFLAASACLTLAWPIAGQDISGRVVIYGRAEDAVSGEPVEGARIVAADSSALVFTDTLGAFAIPLPREGPIAVYADQFGYEAQRFDLELGASPQTFVLLLEPAPLEIEGLTVIEEAALTELTTSMEGRRGAYPGLAVAVDRAQLERFAPASVLDLVRARWPAVRECLTANGSQLCVGGRGRTINNLGDELSLMVCVDERTSFSPAMELDALPVRSVALVEMFRPSYSSAAPPQVRVYTVQWTMSQAEAGYTTLLPLVTGC